MILSEDMFYGYFRILVLYRHSTSSRNDSLLSNEIIYNFGMREDISLKLEGNNSDSCLSCSIGN